MASYKTEKLVQDLSTLPGLAERYKCDRLRILDEYGVPESDRPALLNGTPPALAGIGLHPVLQIHFLLATDVNASRLFDGVLLNRLESE